MGGGERITCNVTKSPDWAPTASSRHTSQEVDIFTLFTHAFAFVSWSCACCIPRSPNTPKKTTPPHLYNKPRAHPGGFEDEKR